MTIRRFVSVVALVSLGSLASGALTLGCSPSSGGGSQPGGPTGPKCDLSSAVPITHDTVDPNESWPSGVHLVPSSVFLSGAGKTLTIAPCSDVRLAKDVSLTFADGAQLVAEGTESGPIRFVRQSASDPWGAILGKGASAVSLAYATLDAGGSSSPRAEAEYEGASLVGVSTDSQPATAALKVSHVTVTGSNGLGVAMVNAKFDASSSDLTVTGAGWFPLYTGAALASELPTGAYTGNAIDAILLQSVEVAQYANSGALTSAETLHDRGVPYQVGLGNAGITVGDGYATSPDGQLTIEAGVTLGFLSSSANTSALLVQAVLRNGKWVQQGALVIAGTAAKPVTLTSAAPTPAAGDWQGIKFKDVVHTASRLDHVIVQYAGGDSNWSGVCKNSPSSPNYTADCSVIMLLDADLGTTQFITNTQIQHGLGCGFYRGWHGTDVDFRGTNSFTDIAGCSQTNIPAPGNQTCDNTVSCPLP